MCLGYRIMMRMMSTFLVVSLVILSQNQQQISTAAVAAPTNPKIQLIKRFVQQLRADDEDDHDHDHDHELPLANWFIDTLYYNLTKENSSDSKIYTEELNQIMLKLKLKNNQSEDHDHDHDHEELACFNSLQLLKIFEIDKETKISRSQFKELCPALIKMAMDDSCLLAEDDHDHDHDEKVCISDRDKYLYGFLSILIISVTSLVSILIVGVFKKAKDSIILSLRALAMGTLLSDALIHLIPSSLGLHTHDDGDHGHDHPTSMEIDEKVIIWKTTVILATIIFLWLLDSFLLGHDHDHDHIDGHNNEHGHGHGHSHHHHHHKHDDHQKIEMKSSGASDSVVNKNKAFINDLAGEVSSTATSGISSSNSSSTTNVDQAISVTSNNEIVEIKTTRAKSIIAYLKSLNSLAWLAFIGDALHNLTDGLAIGAAFSQSMSLGVSTALAILFHEIPHEIGEYGVFISSGLSHFGAVLMNIISATICMISFFIIASVANENSTREWIFAVATGIFLYMSLVNLMPGIKSEIRKAKKEGKRLKKSLLTIFFFAFGCVFMLLLGLFEDVIKFDINATCN